MKKPSRAILRPLCLLAAASGLFSSEISCLAETSACFTGAGSDSTVELQTQVKKLEDQKNLGIDCILGKAPAAACKEGPTLLRKTYQAARGRFSDTNCVDYIYVGISSFDEYYRNTNRSLLNYEEIMTDYDSVDKLLDEGDKRSNEAIYYKDGMSKTKDMMKILAKDLRAEKSRVSTMVLKYKVGLGLGIGASLLGLGLLGGGGYLVGVDGQRVSDTGCPVDGRDTGCILQTRGGAALIATGAVLLVGGILDIGLTRWWLGKQQTPRPRVAAQPATTVVPPPAEARSEGSP